MILKIFSPKNLTKKMALFVQTIASFCKDLIITLVFEKNAIIFAENWQKSLKIVIITSTPDKVMFCIFVPVRYVYIEPLKNFYSVLWKLKSHPLANCTSNSTGHSRNYYYKNVGPF
jgi:hypothetical protein